MTTASPSIENRKSKTKNRPRIGLDFDDTLMPTREAMFTLLNLHHNLTLNHDVYTDVKFIHHLDPAPDTFFNFFNRHEPIIHDQQPYAGVVETLSLWAAHADFYIITGRLECWKPSAADWLRRHGIPVIDILCADKIRKSDAIKDLNLAFFVEDRADFAHDVAATGVPVYLFDRPYNQDFSHPLVTRIKDWQDLRQKTIHLFPHSNGTPVTT